MPQIVTGRCPAWSATANRITDSSSREGAEQQARRINAAWQAVGRTVNARAVQVGEVGSRFSDWSVRSDTINGMPVTC